MPDQILVACFPELRVYGFWGGKGHFAELLKILEKEGATGWGESPDGGSVGSDGHGKVDSYLPGFDRVGVFFLAC